jgi:hypothetical protein
MEKRAKGWLADSPVLSYKSATLLLESVLGGAISKKELP